MVDTRTFPFYRFEGTHREIGRQYGESCRPTIHHHRDLLMDLVRSRTGATADGLLALGMEFRPYVLRHVPSFDEEIMGVAEGSGLSLEEAYFIHLRAELSNLGKTDHECTSFAAVGDATEDGAPLVGQNADLMAFYIEIGVVVEIVPDDAPAVLMVAPAGQISYVGINDRGLAVFGNFLHSDGWRVGFPRYLASRLVLTQPTVDAAIAAVESVPRATSRNLIMADAEGTAADLETTPTRDVRLDPERGLLAHTNHYLAEELLGEERYAGPGLVNSHRRLERMRELLALHRTRLNVETLQMILRDRANMPDPICRMPGEEDPDIVSFTSIIAEPAKRRLWVAVGPPNLHPFQCYEFAPR